MRYGVNGPEINWNFLRMAAYLGPIIVGNKVFDGFRRLNKRCVELGPNKSWEKMRMTHYYSITHPNTLSGLKFLIDNKVVGFENAGATRDFLIHMRGIFNGKFMAPKQTTQSKLRIYKPTHTIFGEMMGHLQWFETGQQNNALWMDEQVHARLRQLVHTSQAVAKDFLKFNAATKQINYFCFCRLANRRLESSNGVVRGLTCADGAAFAKGKAIQRIHLDVCYDNEVIPRPIQTKNA
eukprot:838863_1